MIPFNVPLNLGLEIDHLHELIKNGKYCGDGFYTKKSNELIEKITGCKKVLLTTSCTHSLEMAAILTGIQPGDEVIMPSFTFVSTANAFVLRGAKIIFVDIRSDTMNIDETLIESAITKKTKAIVAVHYGGVACEMNFIMKLAAKYNLFVIEDAAQCINSFYEGQHLGTIGHFGCLSFHETKNIHCGEGGALLINDTRYIERAEIIREKGTDRSKFFRGQVDKYSWVDLGSSYLPSELNAAFLYPQLEKVETITQKRLEIWNTYHHKLLPLKQQGVIEFNETPVNAKHNAHIFCIKLESHLVRQKLQDYLSAKKINAYFHYVPLHSSLAGKKFGVFFGKDIYTSALSEKQLRLPLFYDLSEDKLTKIISEITFFFNSK